MKLRKLTALALVLVLFVCAFAACDNGADTETPWRLIPRKPIP